MSIINNLFNRKRAKQKGSPRTSLESIIAVVIPQKILSPDQSYKDQNGTVIDDWGDYFFSCGSEAARAFSRTYGPNFSFQHTQDPGVETFHFETDEVKGDYVIHGADHYESTGGQHGSTVVVATMAIQQPQIDLKKAGEFYSDIFKTNMLECRDRRRGTYAIMYFGNMYFGKEKVEGGEYDAGIPLLSRLGVFPNEVADLYSVMYFSRHNVRRISPEEWRLLLLEYSGIDLSDTDNSNKEVTHNPSNFTG